MGTVAKLVAEISKSFGDEIWEKGSAYRLVDLGKLCSELKILDDAESFRDIKAIVPLKRMPAGSIAFEVSGSNFSSSFVQFDNGIVVPEWVAEKSGLSHKPYQPQKSMYLC